MLDGGRSTSRADLPRGAYHSDPRGTENRPAGRLQRAQVRDQRIAEVTERTYRDDPKRGTFTYTVRAVDAAGNESPLSKPLLADTSNHEDGD